MTRSPLHQLHADLGARFTDFGGWEMPLRYDSVLDEHRSVRAAAGFFDVSHLGRFSLTGSGATDAVEGLLCNDIGRIEPGRCQYTMVLNDRGGVIDDLIVWWWAPEDFWIMPNAANHERVMGLFAAEEEAKVADLRSETVFLAVQGPEAPALLESLLGTRPGRFRNMRIEWEDGLVSMAGTGYTGEPGAELCTDVATGRRLVAALLAGEAKPCGLGARDTLRLEAGLPLWGADLDETTTPLEAGLSFAVSFDHEFNGREALARQEEHGVERRLTGFVLEDRGIPRRGHPMRVDGGGEGKVTSGNLSPMLETGIGMGYVSPPPTGTGEKMEVEIRSRWVRGHTAKPPFHKDPGDG